MSNYRLIRLKRSVLLASERPTCKMCLDVEPLRISPLRYAFQLTSPPHPRWERKRSFPVSQNYMPTTGIEWNLLAPRITCSPYARCVPSSPRSPSAPPSGKLFATSNKKSDARLSIITSLLQHQNQQQQQNKVTTTKEKILMQQNKNYLLQ